MTEAVRLVRDLTKTALVNDSGHRARADDASAGDPSGRVRKFRLAAAAADFSTNVDFSKILAFDVHEEVLDARRLYAHYVGGDYARGVAKFEEAQGMYLTGRLAFESLWRNGSRFVYGALNIGGMGVEGSFGPFCLLVPRPEDAAPDALGVFPGNTAVRYIETDGAIREAEAAADAASWPRRGDIATVVLASEALAPGADWATVVCSPNKFIEVPRAGAFPIGLITEVRMRRTTVRELDAFRARFFRREALGDNEKNMLAAYDRIHRWRRLYDLKITEVA
jgi:hypothetical protein